MNEMIAQTLSMGVSGTDGYPVHVEVFATGGIPGMEIIGLPVVKAVIASVQP